MRLVRWREWLHLNISERRKTANIRYLANYYLQFYPSNYIVPSMAFISWNDTYNTDIEKIDEQHRKLVDIINKLHDARETGKTQEALDGLLSKLIDYTKYHFDYEEALLEDLNYPELAKHKAMHQELIEQIGMMLRSHLDNKSHVGIALSMFLKAWLLKHILNEDMKALSFKG